jgi:hypothetical protein
MVNVDMKQPAFDSAVMILYRRKVGRGLLFFFGQ